MATEFKLPYTGSEISQKLGMIRGFVSSEAELLSALTDNDGTITLTKDAVIEISRGYTIPTNTHIIGNNAQLVRKTGFEGIMLTCLAGCKVTNLRIDGNREAMVSPTWDNTKEISTRERCVIEDVTIENGNEAITVYGDDVIVRNCKVTNCGGNGIHFSGAHRTRVENCVVINTNLRSGMGHEDGGIIWSNQCEGINCVNNYVENAKSAFGSIDSEGNSYVKIIGNTAKNCQYAVEAVFQSSVPHDIIISNNAFIECNCIDLSRTNGGDNTLVLEPVDVNVIIDGNRFENTGIRAYYCRNVTLDGNIFINHTKNIVVISCERVIFSNNNFDGTALTNYSTCLLSADYVNIVGNHLTGCSPVLRTQYGGKHTIIQGNSITSTGNGNTDTCLDMAAGTICTNNRLSVKEGTAISTVSDCVCSNNIIACETSDVVAIRVWGGNNNFVVTQNISNGTFSISKGDNCFVSNNLTMDALEYATE